MKNVCTLLDSKTHELIGVRFEDIKYAKTKTDENKGEFLVIIHLKDGHKITAKLDNKEHQKDALNEILRMMNVDNDEPPPEVKEMQKQAAKEAYEKALKEAEEAKGANLEEVAKTVEIDPVN